MPEAHSTWSASGFEQRMLCPGSHVLQAGAPRTSSEYSAEGTAAHQLLTWALQEGRDAAAYLGRVIEADGYTFTVDDDMAGFVQVTIDYVKDVAGPFGEVIVDRRVNYARYLDVPEQEAWGTLDVAVLLPDEIIAIDLKFGRGVEVTAGHDVVSASAGASEVDRIEPRPNPQLALYALGALAEWGDFAEFKRARLVISQPRISTKPSEYDLTVDELEAWGRSTARSAVFSCVNAAEADDKGGAWAEVYLRPGDKQCRFCKVKATCPALRDDVLDTVLAAAPATPDEFGDPPGAAHIEVSDDQWLGAALAKVDLIEDWCKAVRAEVERRLLAGQGVPGFKLVQGKRGNRQWSDPEAATKLLRETFRLPVEKAFDLKLISPTSAEKLHKAGEIGPRQWPKAQALIVQRDGAPHVAPVSDSRPALVVTPVADDFNDVTTDAQQNASELASDFA